MGAGEDGGTVRYGSVCSGIEAATVAWHPLGWEPAWFAEIEAFPSAVLSHHYPEVPNHGDFTRIGADAGPVDLLVGGTPCQAFSVAGVREGLDDPRGQLTLEFLALAGRLRPRWVVWENVPGVLSIDGGRTFGTFLGGLGELGYGFAYRVLDAQHFGVPQRRRRVFVVGYLGDWRPPAAVLFERHSLSGDPPPCRQAGQGLAAGTAPSLTGSGRGVERVGEISGQDPVVAVNLRGRDGGAMPECDSVASLRAASGGSSRSYVVRQPSSPNLCVRRLTPLEAERLQGFPDGYTQVPYRGKPAADGPRYRALGNSMAVPVMRWIGEWIALVDSV
jgi:DNA (cytosine-5)-methyltransferase 1